MTDHGKYPPGRGHAWRGEWKERLLDLVRSRGFSSATEFAASTPTRTLVQLSGDLGGGDVAPIQIQWALVEEAKEREAVEYCARDLLVRHLHEVAAGWPAEQGWEPQKAVRRALIAWQGCLRDERHDAVLGRITEALLNGNDVPPGWLPNGVDDPIIVRYFERHWPASVDPSEAT
jgi:hypothetical protein